MADLGSIAAITAFAAKVDIAPSIVVGRMQHEGLLNCRVGNKLRREIDFVALGKD